MNIQLPMENISVIFPITLLSYIFQNLAMKTLAILLAVAAILSVSVTAAGLNNIAYADPPEPDKSCENKGGQDVDDKEGCPGGGNSDQDEKCVAKNKGLQKKQCPED
jgi:hypothetical protein